ncbi:MAG: hemin uptake protein HemP, partial [Hyphomicrobiaceae bacterium]|nr:hemin uptake protein HemP [Hyphomicrobiaceae bacterium]
MTKRCDDPEPAPSRPAGRPRRHKVRDLLDGGLEAILEHGGQEYRLRITASGKLILTRAPARRVASCGPAWQRLRSRGDRRRPIDYSPSYRHANRQPIRGRMTEGLAFALAMGVAAVCGAATGRIFALEAEDRRTSILAAAYCGAGAGLMSGPAFAFVLVLAAELLAGQAIAPALSGAAQVTGPALLWG